MPIDRGLIDQQIQALGESSRWWNERELRDLPAVLSANERILALSRGKIGRVRWLRRSWLIVVTDARLLCIRSASGAGWRQHEVTADQISRVSLRVGPFKERVLLSAGGETYRLLVPRPDGYKLVSALSSLGIARKQAFEGFRPTRMVGRVLDHVLALPAAALDPQPAPKAKQEALPAPDTSGLEQRLSLLEDHVQELRQQVDFLEGLLHERHATVIPTDRPAG